MRLLLVIVVLLTIGGANIANAKTQTEIAVTANRLSFHTQDLGAPGRVSNIESQTWELRDRYGRQIGRLFFFCHWVTERARLCVGEALFRGNKKVAAGTLISSGVPRTTLSGTIAITGGTGRFRGLHGEARFVFVGLDKMQIRYTLE
jgi:hypothetical protein